MMQRSRVLVGGLFLMGGLVLLGRIWAVPQPPVLPPGPRLAVLVVFDQLRADYLEKWQPLFGEGGFRRLQQEGAWFTNCHYPYAYTVTAPGHASMLTGCSPDRHGIVSNDWYDRADRRVVKSITPPAAQAGLGLGPYRRHAESLGDVLLGSQKKGRVVSLSIKDRAAILLAALRAQICLWFNTATGRFETSRYYGSAPRWVDAFNRGKPADRWVQTAWHQLRPDLDYEKYSGPDNFRGEDVGSYQGRTFPHAFPGSSPNLLYYEAVTLSPAGNELLLKLAQKAIVAEKLGQTPALDLLCLSFSSNDLVGHQWGPDSQEVLDITLRSDLIVKELLEFLDAKVGKGNYVFGLCSDHGVCPLPEFSRAKGRPAARVSSSPLTSGAEALLNRTFLAEDERAPWLEGDTQNNPWIYLNRATLKEHGVTSAAAEKTLADWLVTQPGIEAAVTRTDLLSKAALGPMGTSVRKGFDPDRSGDVMVVLKPYYLFSRSLAFIKGPEAGTTHGTPHDYDTHVPLLVLGPRIVPGVRSEPLTPQAIAAILAESLGLRHPASAEAPVPDGLLSRWER